MTTNELLKLKAKAQRHLENHRKCLEELKQECTHPEEHVVEKSRYFGGSYLDMAHTTSWRECAICGARSAETTKTHGYYG